MPRAAIQEIHENPHLSTLETRRRQSAVIEKHPESFQICDDCESLSFAGEIFCPGCQGYRFDDSLEKNQNIIARARTLGGREKTMLVAEDFE